MTILKRRLITIPLYFAAAAVLLGLFPALAAVCLAWDLMQCKRLARTRFLLFTGLYFACEIAGILAGFAIWAACGGPFAARTAHWLNANYALQGLWSAALFHGVSRLYKLDFAAQGMECLDRSAPVLLFMRHASIADTVLPSHFLTARKGIRLRYVMKKELLWDPCLDIVGHRLPNYFVDRTAGDGAQVRGITALMHGLEPGHGVFLYPEGTRFSRSRQKRILERLAQTRPELHEQARGLKHMLPPRFGGALGLLQSGHAADVIFCAHTGFESANKFADFVNGSLIGQQIRIWFFRVPHEGIPRDRDAQARWLLDQWNIMDAWIDKQTEAEPAGKETAAHGRTA